MPVFVDKLILYVVCVVQGLRAQIDRDQYRRSMQECVRGVAGLHLREDSVEDLVIAKKGEGPGRFQVSGVCLGKCR